MTGRVFMTECVLKHRSEGAGNGPRRMVWRNARPTELPPALDVPAGYWRVARGLWRSRDHARSPHPASRIHPVRRDGSRVLAVSRAEWRVARSEPGHTRR